MKSTTGSNQSQITNHEEREVERLLVESGRRPEIPDEDFRLIKAAARAEWSELVASRRPAWTRWGILATAGAAAALAMTVGFGWWKSASPGPVVSTFDTATIELLRGEVRFGDPAPTTRATGTMLASGVELETLPDDDWAANVVAIRLPAGQSVRLRSGSKARLLSASRLELTAGALYVDSGSAANDGKAVAIVTTYGTVVDVGTQFEVRVDEGGEAVRVRVRSGSVALTVDQQSHSAEAGEELRLLEDGSFAKGPFETSRTDIDWTLGAAPSIDIEGLPLTAFLAWIANETGWKILFEDGVLEGAASTIELHGTIEGLRPDEAIRVVLPGSGLGHRLEGNNLHIERLPPGSNGM